MTQSNKLTEGSIFKALFKLAIPIMGTSFVQMAYNMTDMIWVGRIGSRAVASVGTAGFYTWLAMAFILIPKIGAEVGVAQSIGLNGVWWAISISSMLKGTILTIWFIILLKRNPETKELSILKLVLRKGTSN